MTSQSPPPTRRGNAVTLARRFGGFSLASLLSALSPFVAIPLIARTATSDSWSAFNVGTSIGTIVAAVSFVGWSAAGPPLVAATASRSERRSIYAASMRMRIAALSVCAPLGCLASALLTWNGSPVTAALTCFGNTAGGLSLAWFAIGAGAPRDLVRYETVPRVVAAVAGVAVVALTHAAAAYAPLLGAGTLCGLVAFWRQLGGRGPAQTSVPRHSLQFWFRRTRAAWLTELSGNVYSGAPLPIAAALLPAGALATYSSADKLYRWALIAVVIVGNSLQGWVLAPGWSPRRQRFAMTAHALVGVLGGGATALLGPLASRLFFGRDLEAPQSVCAWLGIAFFAISTATPLLRMMILPAALTRSVLWVTVPTAIGGVALMIVLASRFGATGVAAGLAGSELAVVAIAAALTWAQRDRVRERLTRPAAVS